jgi:hypothetical protein
VRNLKSQNLKGLSTKDDTIFFMIQQVNMGKTEGRDEKIKQKKAGKRHERVKGVKKIEGNYFSVVFDENSACVCVCVCMSE